MEETTMSTQPNDNKEIYFELINHDLITGTSLRNMMFVVNGYVSSYNDGNESVKNFARTCKGIIREVKPPSVTKLLEYGFYHSAVRLYYKEHPGISLVEARNHVEKLMAYIDKKKIKYNMQF